MSNLRKWLFLPFARNATGFQNLSLSDWEYRTNAALTWLRRSIEVTGGQGSSHSWSPLFGWQKAYPETTGYLIETLLDYAELKQDDSLRELSLQCANWLVSTQLPSGAFPGLLAGSKEPSVFNTAMILFGLARVNPTPDPSPERRGDAIYAAFDSTEHSTSPLPSGEGSGVGLK